MTCGWGDISSLALEVLAAFLNMLPRMVCHRDKLRLPANRIGASNLGTALTEQEGRPQRRPVQNGSKPFDSFSHGQLGNLCLICVQPTKIIHGQKLDNTSNPGAKE